ncbi:hypothetical protein GALMADRAFT_879375 [Galerina marginata CBS 339.88]|uniref:Uncharacterized protein n=1 Tax=Galerina marginata (strain CBS 339.88) TaxID=685588 RepID=A0A067SKL6_GALM3|nr:hypothetical protein GALMADRAFT_879375 [Galerina marginata CBS 339.88]
MVFVSPWSILALAVIQHPFGYRQTYFSCSNPLILSSLNPMANTFRTSLTTRSESLRLDETALRNGVEINLELDM